ncbi:hypothetical protein BGX28_004197 [Mortierella sp. GBA30]|nr:hypothetical protein BGX28_004197 [Mortierella sp. GBA30]
MYSHQPPQQSNLSRSLPPTPSQLHPSVTESEPVDDYFGESEEVPLPFPIKTIVADPHTGLSLTLISALGAGSYAVVYLAKEVASGTLYALKCLGKDKLTQEEVAVQRNEVDIHMSLPKHRNIVHLFNMFETTQHLFLLMEYSSGMDMYQWISMRSDKVDPVTGASCVPSTRYTIIKTLFDQVLEGVGQVHLCGVAHRDLKPENFLIEFADGQYTVKITDFGLATTDTESDEFECGSKPYMSFECRNGLDTVYNVQMSDLWSLGIILINLLYHRCPWSDPCPQSSYAFSEFLKSRVDFLQRRFEDMPGSVARWLGLRAFAFVGLGKSKRRRTRPCIDEWKKWMNDFVPRMLGEIDTTSEKEEDYDEEEEYREYLALYEDEILEKEVEGEEIIDDDDDNQVVPIAIQSSSLKDSHQSYLDPGRAYASYHVPAITKLGNTFTSSSAPKFDSSAFYQPTRLRQESWSDAIDMEGTEDAEMDFSAPILFEESEEEGAHKEESEDDDDEDSLGLAVALPDDFINPLPHSSATSSGRQTPSTPKMTQLNFNPEKRQLPAHLRLELDSLQQSLHEPSKRSTGGRASPAAEINTLVFIEPDASHAVNDNAQSMSSEGHAMASSLPSTSNMEAAMSPGSVRNKEQPHLKHHMRKPARNLQDVKATPFVFPPLKTPTSASTSMADSMSAQMSVAKEKSSFSQLSSLSKLDDKEKEQAKKTPGPSSSKSNIYIIPKRSQLGPWGAQAAAQPSSRPHDISNASAGRHANWRKGHHRGGSWTSTDELWDPRKDASRYANDGARTSSGKWRARLEDREDGHVGLPPRVENKFRPRYRQGRNRFPPHGNANAAALPPAPPMTHSGFGGPRSRHQSRSGAVFDNAPWGNPQSASSNMFKDQLQQQQQQQHQSSQQQHYDQTQQQQQQQQSKYENSQLRLLGKGSLGSSSMSRLAGQRNKSLVDLRAIDAPTSHSWRQPTTTTASVNADSSNSPASSSNLSQPVTNMTKARSQSGTMIDSSQRRGAYNGSHPHPLEQQAASTTTSLSSKSRLTDRLATASASASAEGETPSDNVYHPPHWHERKSSVSSLGNPLRRPSSGYDSDYSGGMHSLPSRNRIGSRGKIAGHQASASMTSPSTERKHQHQPHPADTVANWRGGGGGGGETSQGQEYSHVGGGKKFILEADGPSSDVLSPTSFAMASVKTDGLADSPLMMLTPPTPSVNVKSGFLSDAPVNAMGSTVHGQEQEIGGGGGSDPKKIVKPGTMAGLGSMLRGLVAYNKSIKVGGEGIGVAPESSHHARGSRADRGPDPKVDNGDHFSDAQPAMSTEDRDSLDTELL